MKTNNGIIYQCPYSQQPLELVSDEKPGNTVQAGHLASPMGVTYPIINGIPHLVEVKQEKFSDEEKKEFQHYQSTSQNYDAVINWIFKSFFQDEVTVRNQMIDLLDLKPHHRVLETGCGTCEDSVYIARRLGKEGELFMQDLSPNMLNIGKEKMTQRADQPMLCSLEFFVGNASCLPFPDGYFDAAYHFGGINLFTDRKKAIAEMARVVRIGGKVVIGDESMAPWLKDTLYGNILMNSNKLFQYPTTIEFLPESARDVCLRWLLGNAYYLINFTVGEGAPKVDLDLPILGKRGGTHRTRYYGSLENVSVETKQLALEAAERSGLSIHDWLNQAVKKAAQENIE